MLYISGHDFDQSNIFLKWPIRLPNYIYISIDKTAKYIVLRIPNNKKFHTWWYLTVFVWKSNCESFYPTVIEINKSSNINFICKKKKNTTASVRKTIVDLQMRKNIGVIRFVLMASRHGLASDWRQVISWEDADQFHLNMVYRLEYAKPYIGSINKASVEDSITRWSLQTNEGFLYICHHCFNKWHGAKRAPYRSLQRCWLV